MYLAANTITIIKKGSSYEYTGYIVSESSKTEFDKLTSDEYCKDTNNTTPDITSTPEVTTTIEFTTPSVKLQCPYSKSNVKIIKTSRKNKFDIYPIYPNFNYTEPDCTSHEGILFDINTGNITVDGTKNINYVKCEVKCQDGSRSSKTVITIAVIEYEPYINRYASKVPVMVNSNEKFEAKITVSYPSNDKELKEKRKTIEMGVSLESDKQNDFTLNPKEKKITNQTNFEWNDLNISYTASNVNNNEDTTPVIAKFQSNYSDMEISYTINVFHGGIFKYIYIE